MTDAPQMSEAVFYYATRYHALRLAAQHVITQWQANQRFNERESAPGYVGEKMPIAPKYASLQELADLLDLLYLT